MFTSSFSTFLPSCIQNKHLYCELQNKSLSLLLYNQLTRLDGKPKTEISYLENSPPTSYPHDNNIGESNRSIFHKKPLVSQLYSTNLSNVYASNYTLTCVNINFLVREKENEKFGKQISETAPLILKELNIKRRKYIHTKEKDCSRNG